MTTRPNGGRPDADRATTTPFAGYVRRRPGAPGARGGSGVRPLPATVPDAVGDRNWRRPLTGPGEVRRRTREPRRTGRSRRAHGRRAPFGVPCRRHHPECPPPRTDRPRRSTVATRPRAGVGPIWVSRNAYTWKSGPRRTVESPSVSCCDRVTTTGWESGRTVARSGHRSRRGLLLISGGATQLRPSGEGKQYD
jgi:hypothetical protein